MGQSSFAKQFTKDNLFVGNSTANPFKNAQKKSKDTREFFTNEQVFGNVEDMEFSLVEAKKYLEQEKSEFEKLLSSDSLTSKTGKDGHTVYPVNDLRNFRNVLRINIA